MNSSSSRRPPLESASVGGHQLPTGHAKSIGSESGDLAISEHLPGLLGLGESVKSFIETTVANAYLQQLLVDVSRSDTPFDAVYVSALLPDLITKADRETLTKYSGIKDQSHLISFGDDADE